MSWYLTLSLRNTTAIMALAKKMRKHHIWEWTTNLPIKTSENRKKIMALPSKHLYVKRSILASEINTNHNTQIANEGCTVMTMCHKIYKL